MSVIIHPAEINEQQWHEMRNIRIGASDAGSIFGEDKSRSNIMLWKIKTGQKESKDISDIPIVRYGIEAEEHLRALFELDWRWKYEVHYRPFDIRIHPEYDCICCTLDGWLIEKATGRFGVLEIKAAWAHNSAQYKQWSNKVPQKYYIQLCTQAACTKADFAVLHYQIKSEEKDKTSGEVIKVYSSRNSYLYDNDQFKIDIQEVERVIPQWHQNHVIDRIKPERNSI